MRINAASFIVLDTETTGISYADGDRLVEFAAKRYPDGDELSMLVHPGRSIPVISSAVHGLVDADVAGAASLDEAYREIDKFVGSQDIAVAHNAAFDTTMLPCLASRRTLCTRRLAQHLVPEAPAFSNAVLRYHFGGAQIDLRGIPTHRALADVLVTSFILGRLLHAYAAAGHPDDVDALLSFAAAPYIVKTILFGKHAGTAITDLPLDYLQWGVGSRGFTDDPDLLHTFRSELGRRRGQFEFATPRHSLADRVGAV